MDILKRDDLQQLIGVKDEYCISLYMPTHRTGREQQQDPIRFKNLVTEAEKKLTEYGVSSPKVRELMRPAKNLLTEAVFWQHQMDGLAVFLSRGFFRTYRLPFQFKDLAVFGKNFHIKPLLPLLSPNGHFYILAVSLNEIHLFRCTRDTISEVELSGMATSMQEALHTDDPESHLDLHTGTSNPSAPGSRPAMFHGQGVQSKEVDKKNILRYFQYIDRKLDELLEDKSFPMILAGVEYLRPIYQTANSYPRLLKDGLTGNPDELRPEELLTRAWDLIQSVFNEERKNALKQFEQLYGDQSGLVSDHLETVVKAATFGRVDTLFSPLGLQRWGHFDEKNGRVLLDKEQTLENEDLLNFAVVQTILNSGQVFVLEPDEIPGDGELAAILRYAK